MEIAKQGDGHRTPVYREEPTAAEQRTKHKLYRKIEMEPVKSGTTTRLDCRS